MTDYAAVVTFPESSKTYEAFSRVTTAAPGLAAAAVVERNEDGMLRVADATDPDISRGFVGGSLIGALVGVLGGPLGMLLGWGAGALIGSGVDADRADDTQDVLTAFSRQIQPGGNGLIVQTGDAGLAAVQDVAAQLGGALVSRPLDDILDGLAAERQAQDAAAKAAREHLRSENRAERKEKWQDRWDDMLGSLSRHDRKS